MEKQVYIIEKERVKCQKVADAFAELYEMESIVVIDAGRYGFVMLKYYKPPYGFAEDETFTDSKALFDALWKESYDMMTKEMGLVDFSMRKCSRTCQKKNSR